MRGCPRMALATGDIRDRIILGFEGCAHGFVAAGGTMRPNGDLLCTAGIVLTVVHALTGVAADPLQMLALFSVFHILKLLSEFFKVFPKPSHSIRKEMLWQPT